jgi:hypothetical protein
MTTEATLVREIVEHCRTRPHLLRRQGPTFLQLEPTPDIWLHFWGQVEDPNPTIAAQAHTHHRDFSSTIVFGSITNTILKFKDVDPKRATYEEYLLQGGDAMSAAECVPTGRSMDIEHASNTPYYAGDMYDMVADSWHRTLFLEPSITLLQLKGEVVPRYIAWSAGMKAEDARLKWVKVDPVEAWQRIDNLLALARIP